MNPETYPHTIALSDREIIGLVKWHTAQIKRTVKRAGQAMLEISTSPMPKGRALKALHDEAETIVTFHQSRAKELLAVVKPTTKGTK